MMQNEVVVAWLLMCPRILLENLEEKKEGSVAGLLFNSFRPIKTQADMAISRYVWLVLYIQLKLTRYVKS